jgi:hypothetical protein
MNNFSQLNIKIDSSGFEGDKIRIIRILDREIIVHKFEIRDSKAYPNKGNGKCLYLQISLNEEKHIVFTSAVALIEAIQKVPQNCFPFATIIKEENQRYKFT